MTRDIRGEKETRHQCSIMNEKELFTGSYVMMKGLWIYAGCYYYLCSRSQSHINVFSKVRITSYGRKSSDVSD